jgi:hypothetical protein
MRVAVAAISNKINKNLRKTPSSHGYKKQSIVAAFLMLTVHPHQLPQIKPNLKPQRLGQCAKRLCSIAPTEKTNDF